MIRKILALGACFVFAISFAAAADTAQMRSNISASEIANKNIASRGGLQAWRSVQAITWTGKLGAGGNRRSPVPVAPEGKKVSTLPTDPRPAEEVQLPFRMEMQRPRKQRLEIDFYGKTAVQIFDGAKGWKLRPYLNRLEVEPFTADELKSASMQSELDGPLVDYAAKGTRIELDGMDKVENRDTYKLKLTMKDGHSNYLWIDAQTFLEAKIEAQPRRLDGIDHPVEVYYRDYRLVNGLQVPFVLETKVLPVAGATPRVRSFDNTPLPIEKIVIDKVEVNPKLDASLFVKPEVQTASIRH